MNLFHVDAFARHAFAGNPAAVCLLESFPGDDWLRHVAAEMNLSETAFVCRSESGFDLRWFTPVCEVDLCGHATLASAHILWSEGIAASDEIRFATRSGMLIARCGEDESGPTVELDFPATPPQPASPPDGLLEALGTTAEGVARSRFDYLVHVADETRLRELTPNFARLINVETRGVIVTAAADGTHDFVSRFFCPAVGVNEDPVTGSAHCCLAPYWGERLGKTELKAFQASARGGEVGMRLDGERVILSGSAITVSRGELLTMP